MKPKIPKMSKKKRQEWIDACKKLLAWYQKKEIITCCPFCSIIINRPNVKAVSRCHVGGCIWNWFTGGRCSDYIYTKGRRYCVGDLRKNRPLKWTHIRIKQLKQWIRTLEAL